jgi:predicted aconitase
VRLSDEERAILTGREGPAAQRAMEIVAALGEIYGAEDLVPVVSAQVAGVSYGNLGEAGLEFLRIWADEGARVVVPTTLNPAGMDLHAWGELGIPEEYARHQLEVVEAYRAMGITISCSCTPYLTGNVPRFGQHIAWSESSAVSYANSALGARSNREGGPSALAAAITGRTARYGLHLDHNRQGQLLVDVGSAVGSPTDFSALGYMVGQVAADRVPYFRLHSGPEPGQDELKALGAAMAASGAVALYHVEGLTPEAGAGNMLASGAPVFNIDSLDEGYQALDGTSQGLDLVWIGCPHASLAEIEHTADLLDGARVEAKLWVTTAREVLETARIKGLAQQIETCGGRVVADTCLIGAPVGEMGLQNVATNSGKGAFYLRNHSHLQVRFGSLAQCVEAAIIGRWPG